MNVRLHCAASMRNRYISALTQCKGKSFLRFIHFILRYFKDCVLCKTFSLQYTVNVDCVKFEYVVLAKYHHMLIFEFDLLTKQHNLILYKKLL